jgi:hypothetical protein
MSKNLIETFSQKKIVLDCIGCMYWWVVYCTISTDSRFLIILKVYCYVRAKPLGSVEVFQRSLGVRLDGLVTLLPASGANLTVLISELESLNETEGLINRSANGQVVDGNLTTSYKSVAVPLTIRLSQVITYRTVPLGSMMKRPRRATPSSSIRTP